MNMQKSIPKIVFEPLILFVPPFDSFGDVYRVRVTKHKCKQDARHYPEKLSSTGEYLTLMTARLVTSVPAPVAAVSKFARRFSNCPLWKRRGDLMETFTYHPPPLSTFLSPLVVILDAAPCGRKFSR